MKKRLTVTLLAFAALSLPLSAQWAGGIYEGDFPELRNHIAEQLRAHPGIDRDILQRGYLESHYGKAADAIDWYLRMSRKAMEIGGKERLLSERMLTVYDDYFDRAEAAVSSPEDSLFFRAVCIARLPLQYVELELAKSGETIPGKPAEILDRFAQRCQQFDISEIPDLESNTIAYCELYKSRWIGLSAGRFSLGKTLHFRSAPSPKFDPENAARALTDGRFGDREIGAAWVGWEGADPDLVIDLGKPCEISAVSCDFLIKPNLRILAPLRVSYSLSNDGKEFKNWVTIELDPADYAADERFLPVRATSPKPLRAQHLRVHITSLIDCPGTHPDAGEPVWIYLDEITID